MPILARSNQRANDSAGAAGSTAPVWGRATPQKLWPKANAQLGARPQYGVARRRKANPQDSPAEAGWGPNSKRPVEGRRWLLGSWARRRSRFPRRMRWRLRGPRL